MKKRFVYILASILLMVYSCVKRDTKNPVPKISFHSFDAINENEAFLTISYSDGDGDIFVEKGTKEPNFFAWFYYKNENGEFVPFLERVSPIDTAMMSIPKIATLERPSELSKNQPIKGQIRIHMITWRGDSKIKNFKYKMYMVDQKGNQSEEVMTPEIVVNF